MGITSVNNGKDKEQQVGSDQKKMSTVHCVSGPKILEKALNDSDKLKYIDNDSVDYYLSEGYKNGFREGFLAYDLPNTFAEKTLY